jgi:outer membrane protein assembly factor BamB
MKTKWMWIGLGLALAGASTTTVSAGEWPQWRGPERTGVAVDEPALNVSASTTPVWSVPLLPGREEFYGSPVVAEGKVLFHYCPYKPGADMEAKKKPTVDILLCVGMEDGKELWRVTRDSAVNRTGSPHVPVVWKGRVYSYTAQGLVQAIDLATGKELWTLALGWTKVGDAVASPLVVDDVLIIHGAELVAIGLDGTEQWRVKKVPAKWKSPTVWRKDGKAVILAEDTKELGAYAAADGKRLWSVPALAGGSSPVVLGDVLVRGRDNEGNVMGGVVIADLTLEGLKNERSIEFRCGNGGHNAATPVVIGGKAWCGGLEEYFCLDLATAQPVWRVAAKGNVKPSPILVNDVLLVTGKNPGLLLLNAADGTTVGQAKLKTASCSSVALSNGRLVYQDGKTLLCLDLHKLP